MKRKLLVILALAWTMQPLISFASPSRNKEAGTSVSSIHLKTTTIKGLPQAKFAVETTAQTVYVAPTVAPTAVITSTASSGWHYDCESQQSAVEAATAQLLGSDASYANYIFSHESCEDPGRLNSIGACGLAQANPCAKLGCGPTDIVCQVNWATGYANSRYGSWGAAYAFWLSNLLW